jgi:hypothetical protein
MLANAIIDIFYRIAQKVLNLIPDVSISDNISSAVATASQYISALNTIAPVNTLIAIIGIFLTLELIMLTIKIINWFIRKIPTIS